MKDRNQVITAIVVFLIIIAGVLWLRNRSTTPTPDNPETETSPSFDRLFSNNDTITATPPEQSANGQASTQSVSREFNPVENQTALGNVTFTKEGSSVGLAVTANLPDTDQVYNLWVLGEGDKGNQILGQLSSTKGGYLLETSVSASLDLNHLVISRDSSSQTSQPDHPVLELTL